jgi:hexosaminidase
MKYLVAEYTAHSKPRPTEDKAIKLIQTVYKEVMSVLPGKLFGTGGDEINLLCFENDTITQTALEQNGQTILQAIGEFVKATHATVRYAQKTPVIWEDTVVGDEAIPLGGDTIVTAWRGNDTFASILDAGLRTILSSYELSYLDW